MCVHTDVDPKEMHIFVQPEDTWCKTVHDSCVSNRINLETNLISINNEWIYKHGVFKQWNNIQ